MEQRPSAATLELQLRVEKIQKRGAQRQADINQWQATLWRTITITTWVALAAWRIWQYLTN